jgi:hypothetical protein
MEMSRLKSRVGGTTPTNSDNWESHYIQFFDGTENRYAMGYFEDNKLQTFICILLHENKARGKFWLIWAFFSRKFNNFFNFNDSDKGLLLKEAFSFAESKGYYEYYYWVSKRISKVYERQWLRNNFMKTGRYDLIDLDVVPANTIPEVDLYQKMLLNTTKPDDIYFKKRVLKEKYRNK